jgi:probable rRNA maturation factor
MTLSTEIQQRSTDPRIPGTDALSRWAGTAFSAVSQGNRELTIRIVDREEGAELNRRYRSAERATNVLSFDYANDPHAPAGTLGDLVICAPVVSEEAAAQNKALDAHWAHMVVHGVLHLCGYDHEEAEAARSMEDLETKILRDLGFPAPYE